MQRRNWDNSTHDGVFYISKFFGRTLLYNLPSHIVVTEFFSQALERS